MDKALPAAMPAIARYVEYSPPSALRRFVKRVWVERGTLLPSPRGYTVLPDGCMQIIFNLGGRELRHDPRGEPVHQGPALLVGIATRPQTIYVSGRADTVGIQFRPGRASAFLGLPACEVTDAIVELSAAWSAYADEVVDRLAAVQSTDARFRIIESALLERVDRGPCDLRALEPALDLIVHSPDRTPMSALAAASGLSTRHLRRRFRELVGVSPKLYARVARFRRVANRIGAQGCPAVAEMACEYGYSDQAHLTREFREFSGRTPRQFSRGE